MLTPADAVAADLAGLAWFPPFFGLFVLAGMVALAVRLFRRASAQL